VVRGDGAAALRRRHRSFSAVRVRQAASTMAHAVRGAARSGGHRVRLHLPGPGRHVGARRLRRAREHGHHLVFHSVPLYVRLHREASAQAGRSRCSPHSRRRAGREAVRRPGFSGQRGGHRPRVCAG
jgi:hypothetical protein